MSLVVMAIGGAHALPPLVGAVISKAKKGTIIGAAIGVGIAFFGGNPAFITADLIGAGIGTWLGLKIVANR